jgi:arylsulfatase A-like enzyme/Tfp pilus assembly protein PilF
MRRRTLALFLFAAAIAGCTSPKPERPSVLLITIDTLRADRLGAYGYRQIETPAMDALAREGVLFERAIAQVPLTWPSHVVMLTGTYPFHNGVQDFTGQPLAEKFRTLAESFRANGYATGAVVSSFVLDRSWGLARGFDFYYDEFAGLGAGEKDLGLVDRRAEESVSRALAWLGEQQQPYFFWLHLFDPHSPYDAPEPFRTRYGERPYDGEVAYVDSQLARVFDWLRSQPKGAYENTVIVLVGDHGESLGEHGEQEHGFFLYDSTIRVPLLIKAPARAGLKAGRIGAAVETTALGPTILELAGIQDAIQKQFQAESLLARMRDAATEAARPAYSETFYPFSSFGWSPLRSLQTSRYQFIEAPQPELYDLRADPAQSNNLARTETKLVESFRGQLRELTAKFAAAPTAQPAGGQSADVAEKLRTLGYVAYRAPTTSLDPAKLKDPKERLAAFNAILRATDAFSAGNYAAGQALLARVEREEPRLYLIAFMRGEAAARAGDWKTAAAEFQKALNLNPGFDQAMLGLGRTLNYLGKEEQAAAWLEKALAQNAANYRAWFELSRVQARRDAAAARASLEKTLAIQPAFGPAHRDLGLLAMKEQRYTDGALHFERAVQLGLNDAATHNFLGICYSRTDRLPAAVDSYQRALVADDKFAQAHLNLGFAYERMGRGDDARREYDTACRLDRRICKMIQEREKR